MLLLIEINNQKGKYIKYALEHLEQRHLDQAEYTIIRKIILDSFNEFYREIVKLTEEV